MITTDNLIQTMINDFVARFDSPLGCTDGEKARVLKVARTYNLQKFVAMWNIYLADPKESDYGIGLDKFIDTARLNKYAVKLKYQAPEREPVKQGPLPRYFCENAELPGFHYIRIGDGQDGWPERCPDCGGTFLTEEAWHIMRYGSYDTTPATREDIKAAFGGLYDRQAQRRKAATVAGVPRQGTGRPLPVGSTGEGPTQYEGGLAGQGTERGDGEGDGRTGAGQATQESLDGVGAGADLDLTLDDLEGTEDFF
mgnify:CR=1 FL=1